MRSTKEALQQVEQTTEEYVRELESLSVEQLGWKPGESEWSIGQVVQHLIQSAHGMQLGNVAACMEGAATPTTLPSPQAAAAAAVAPPAKDVPSPVGKSQVGEAIFAAGELPPIRVQVPPSAQYTPLQPESKAQLVQGLQSVIDRMRTIEPTLADAPSTTVPHPRFSGLNAQEWFVLIGMHYRHHLRQLERLKQEWARASRV
ncbi:MAG: hypothetical protein K0R75_1699 [Paenibacillaceae bacterium]|jgi:hypothetical protein|nr:hypothetical protein [Paenibacillaceae bacterium]